MEIFEFSVVACDFDQQIIQVTGSDPAGHAFPARLRLRESQEEFSKVYDTCILIQDDKAAGTHDRSGFGEVFIINWNIQEFLREASARWSPGLDRLEWFLHAPADIENDLPQGGSHRDLDQSRPSNLTHKRECFRALAGFRSVPVVPCSAVSDYVWKGSESLDIVDDRGLSPETLVCGERRTASGHSALALDRCDQSGFLTADKRSRALLDFNFEIEPASENIFSQNTE